MPSTDNPEPEPVVLTDRQAFLVMTDYIWRYAPSAGDDLITLLGETTIQAEGGPTDPAAWTVSGQVIDRGVTGERLPPGPMRFGGFPIAGGCRGGRSGCSRFCVPSGSSRWCNYDADQRVGLRARRVLRLALRCSW